MNIGHDKWRRADWRGMVSLVAVGSKELVVVADGDGVENPHDLLHGVSMLCRVQPVMIGPGVSQLNVHEDVARDAARRADSVYH